MDNIDTECKVTDIADMKARKGLFVTLSAE